MTDINTPNVCKKFHKSTVNGPITKGKPALDAVCRDCNQDWINHQPERSRPELRVRLAKRIERDNIKYGLLTKAKSDLTTNTVTTTENSISSSSTDNHNETAHEGETEESEESEESEETEETEASPVVVTPVDPEAVNRMLASMSSSASTSDW